MTPLARLAASAARHPRHVLAAWLLVLGLAVGLGPRVAGEFNVDYATPGSDSSAASELLGGRSVDTVDVVWHAPDVRAIAVKRRIDTLLRHASAVPGVGAADAPRVAVDGQAGLARLPLDRPAWDTPRESGRQLMALARDASRDGLRVEVGGAAIQQAQAAASPEFIGLLAAALIMLLAFGSLIAASLPLVVALVSLGVSSSLIGVLASVMEVPDWAPAVGSLVGIGVALDYSLLILTRFRSELARGVEPRAAVVAAVSTAGRSVLVAGGVVTVSLLGLLLVGLPYLRGVAVSASLSVLVVMTASVTLLPALLAWFGHNVNRLRVGRAPRDGRRAGAWVAAVQRRPRLSALAATAVLLALAAPVAGLRLGIPDAGNDRAGTATRAAYDLVADGFGPGANGRLLLVGDVDPALAERVRGVPGVASVEARGERALTVVPAASPQDRATLDLVRRLRSEVGPNVHVGGATAGIVDMGDALSARLPVFVGGVLALAFVLLVATFRAPVLALKAGLLNLLSIGAAYGVVALVAEWGALGGLVGIAADTPVPPFIPVIMFAILFGLSMDYEVFLLSRVREELLVDGDARRALANGIAKTARVIAAAAATMVAVFAAFVAAPEVFLRLMGIGLATAIIVDVTLVRLILVPSIMELLGGRNWWIPRWLDRVMPRPMGI